MQRMDYSTDVRNLLTKTKVSTILRDQTVLVLKQESTVELALQVDCPVFASSKP